MLASYLIFERLFSVMGGRSVSIALEQCRVKVATCLTASRLVDERCVSGPLQVPNCIPG